MFAHQQAETVCSGNLSHPQNKYIDMHQLLLLMFKHIQSFIDEKV